MRIAIIRICDYMIDYMIAGDEPDTRFTSVLGDVANYLETKKHVLFDNISVGKMIFYACLCLIALA